VRNLNLLDLYRDVSPSLRDRMGTVGDETCGAFNIPSPIDGAAIRVVASSDLGWDHVSVSRRNRCPNWYEMEHVKRMFFHDHETAMQLHVPPADHINCHPYCLHLWRPHDVEIPRPPAWMVGPVKEPSNA
jgi:hypothetical protein